MVANKHGVITQQDNDHVEHKVALRTEAVRLLGEPRPIQVMDAYHGHGVLWPKVQEHLPEWEVSVFGVDSRPRSVGTLRADNVRLLQSIDLSGFDLFDLDSYGWPANTLRVIAAKAPERLVVSTRISPQWARIPLLVTDDLGFVLPPGSRQPGGPMTVLVTSLAEEFWEAWLFKLGYRRTRLYRFDDFAAGTAQAVKRYETLIPDGFPVPAWLNDEG